MLSNNKKTIRNLAILLGSMLPILATQSAAPALPAMAEAFKEVPNAEFLARLTLTMPALVIAIAAPFSGALLDRWGRKPVLVSALVLFILVGSTPFLLNSLTAILVSRAILGLAIAGVLIGFTTLITDYFTGARLNQFMGYQGAAIGLGGVIFLLVGGLLAGLGWRFPFLLHLFAIIVLLGVLVAIDEPEIKAAPSQAGPTPGRAGFPLKSLAIIYGVAFFFMLLFYIVPVQLPFLLTSLIGVGSSQVGLALAVPTLSSIVFSLQYQRFKARLSFRSITSLFFLTLGLGYLIIASTTNFGIVLVGLAITGIGLGLIVPSLNVWVASVTLPAMRGLAIGGMTMSLFLGLFISPIAAQPIVQQVGLSDLYIAAGVLAALLAALFLGLAVREHSTPDTQTQSSN